MSSKSQSERFKEAARQSGADDSPDALDRAFCKLDVRHKSEPKAGDKKGDDKDE